MSCFCQHPYFPHLQIAKSTPKSCIHTVLTQTTVWLDTEELWTPEVLLHLTEPPDWHSTSMFCHTGRASSAPVASVCTDQGNVCSLVHPQPPAEKAVCKQHKLFPSHKQEGLCLHPASHPLSLHPSGGVIAVCPNYMLTVSCKSRFLFFPIIKR